MTTCPSCTSERIRRGGMIIWSVYVALIAFALVTVLLFHLDAVIVAAVMITVVVLVHLVVRERICVDCGHQWRS